MSERIVAACARHSARPARSTCRVAAGRTQRGRGASTIRPLPMLTAVTAPTGSSQVRTAATLRPRRFGVGGEPDPEGGVGEDVGVGAERRGRAGAPGEPPVDEVGGHGEACQPRVPSADDGGEVAAGQGEEVGGAEVGAILEQAKVRARQQPAGRDPAPTRRRGHGQEQAVKRGHLGQGAWMQAGLVDRAFGRRDEELRPRGRAPTVRRQGREAGRRWPRGSNRRRRGGRASARGAAHRRGVGLPADRRSLSARMVSRDWRTVATQLRATTSPHR